MKLIIISNRCNINVIGLRVYVIQSIVYLIIKLINPV